MPPPDASPAARPDRKPPSPLGQGRSRLARRAVAASMGIHLALSGCSKADREGDRSSLMAPPLASAASLEAPGPSAPHLPLPSPTAASSANEATPADAGEAGEADAGESEAGAVDAGESEAGAADAGSAGGGEGDGGSPGESEAPRTITAGCYEQAPLPFLVRGSYWPVKEHRDEHARAVRWRAERYGEIKKLTPRGLNAHEVGHYAQTVSFFGLSVDVHRAIAPALRCVERELVRACGAKYRPQVLAGYRKKNTYHQGEITNHLFGIAIDVDPHRNACCHCIEPWSLDPHCKEPNAPAWEHMEMPRCWVETFERFGFYWLGHDRLQDTMHFEFLGDPDQIVPKPAKKPGR